MNQSSMPDQYIKQILEGDKEAFRHIIRECKDGAYSLALSILKEEHAAKDAVQSAFLKAYQNLKSFRRDSGFKTWFHRIVVNEAYQMARSRKSKVPLNLGKLEGDMSRFNSASIRVNHEHMKYYINETMNRMKPNESLSLKLFYLEEHTIEEMTDITEWSKSKVKVTLHRARKSMKELMKDTFNLKPEELYQ